MKKLLLALLIIFSAFVSNAQREFEYTEGDTTYVMKRYVFMLLESGKPQVKTLPKLHIIRKCTLSTSKKWQTMVS